VKPPQGRFAKPPQGRIVKPPQGRFTNVPPGAVYESATSDSLRMCTQGRFMNAPLGAVYESAPRFGPGFGEVLSVSATRIFTPMPLDTVVQRV
jgi:hypothetical protein